MDIFLYQYPLTVVLAVGFMLLTWIVFRFAGSTLVRVLGSWKAGALCMTAMVPFVVAEGTWRTEWHHSIPFVVIVMVFLLCLGLSIMTRLQGGLRHHSSKTGVIEHPARWWHTRPLWSAMLAKPYTAHPNGRGGCRGEGSET